MIIDPQQRARWNSQHCIAFTIGPDHKDTPARDRFFHFELLKSGKPSAPKMPGKNALYSRNAAGGNRLSPAQRVFRDKVRACIQANRLETYLGEMRIAVHQTYGGNAKTVGDVKFPGMDASATLEAVCDALQSGPGFRGLVKDDAQITKRTAEGFHTKGTWSLWVCLERITG